MTMRGFDRSVLVAYAGVVTGRLDAIVIAKCLVSGGGIVVRRKIAVGRRQTVSAVGGGCAAELPERLLHAFGQRREALAAFDHLDMLPARKGQPEMKEQMIEGPSGDRNLKIGRLGKITQ